MVCLCSCNKAVQFHTPIQCFFSTALRSLANNDSIDLACSSLYIVKPVLAVLLLLGICIITSPATPTTVTTNMSSPEFS